MFNHGCGHINPQRLPSRLYQSLALPLDNRTTRQFDPVRVDVHTPIREVEHAANTKHWTAIRPVTR